MREHLISCLEKGEFRPFSKCKVSQKGKVKQKSCVIEANCECGEADSIENMVGCEWKNGVKICNVWKHISCAIKDNKQVDNWLCSKHTAWLSIKWTSVIFIALFVKTIKYLLIVIQLIVYFILYVVISICFWIKISVHTLRS